MSGLSALLLVLSTAIFVGAASSAKAWALSANNIAWLALTLVLYTIGNLIMLRLIRDVGMGVALSLSAVVQLLTVNIVALAFFGERVSTVQAIGLVLAIIAVSMIAFDPARR
jgi:multidrug transporter EmrE-like cation transporter